MKITEITLHPILIPRHNGLQTRHVIVQIQTDEGIAGIGEMSDFGHLPAYMPNLTDLARTLNANLAGCDPLQRVAIERHMLQSFPESNLIYDMSMVIRTGISLALYDLAGKYYGCRVSELLGGGREAASVKIAYPIFRQSSEQELRSNLDLAERQHKLGFSAFHIYVGLNIALEIEFIAELYNRLGKDIQVSVDGSNLLSWKESLKIARQLQAFPILYYESPALRNDLAGTAEFRKRSDLPTSEHIWSMPQAEEALRRDCLDMMNVTLTFAGGMEYALKLLHLSEAMGKSLVVGTTQELSIGSSAQAQFAAVATNLRFPSHITGPLLYAKDVVQANVEYRDGCLLVPEGDGLGMTLDDGLLREATAELVWGDASLSSVMHRRA